ncbi:MAG: adenylate/guanylate cyclase domain-containing protein, partial [Pseudomonadota bacterium]
MNAQPCPHCTRLNPPSARFCEQCGVPQLRCTACSAPISRDAHFCGQCGIPQADRSNWGPSAGPRAERRMLSVLMSDLVDFTGHTEALEQEALRELLREYHAVCDQAIRRYEGFVAQFLGDGVLAYFGYPRAHEDDAERAVRAALDIQRALANGLGNTDVQARIAVHTGQVIIDEVGA